MRYVVLFGTYIEAYITDNKGNRLIGCAICNIKTD